MSKNFVIYKARDDRWTVRMNDWATREASSSLPGHVFTTDWLYPARSNRRMILNHISNLIERHKLIKHAVVLLGIAAFISLVAFAGRGDLIIN